MTWQHQATYVLVRGRTKVMCACGAQSKKYRNPEKAVEWYGRHTEMREKPVKGVRR